MADKSKTIKNATDKELHELIVRLRKENEAQTLIVDLKRKSDPGGFTSWDRPEVSTEEPIESLYHYGVLGMQWGKRRGGATKSSKTKTPKVDTSSPDHKKKVALKKKSIKEMSNEELRELTTRMQLEKQYKDLRKSDVSAGQKVVNELLAQAVKQTASVYVGKYMAKGAEQLLKTALK